MENVKIRRATPEDKTAVLRINRDVYEGRDYLPAYYDHFLSSPTMFPAVALHRDTIVSCFSGVLKYLVLFSSIVVKIVKYQYPITSCHFLEKLHAYYLIEEKYACPLMTKYHPGNTMCVSLICFYYRTHVCIFFFFFFHLRSITISYMNFNLGQ